MVDNVVTKIKEMQLSITNGHELYDYISQSKMVEEHKAKLARRYQTVLASKVYSCHQEIENVGGEIFS